MRRALWVAIALWASGCGVAIHEGPPILMRMGPAPDTEALLHDMVRAAEQAGYPPVLVQTTRGRFAVAAEYEDRFGDYTIAIECFRDGTVSVTPSGPRVERLNGIYYMPQPLRTEAETLARRLRSLLPAPTGAGATSGGATAAWPEESGEPAAEFEHPRIQRVQNTELIMHGVIAFASSYLTGAVLSIAFASTGTCFSSCNPELAALGLIPLGHWASLYTYSNSGWSVTVGSAATVLEAISLIVLFIGLGSSNPVGYIEGNARLTGNGFAIDF